MSAYINYTTNKYVVIVLVGHFFSFTDAPEFESYERANNWLLKTFPLEHERILLNMVIKNGYVIQKMMFSRRLKLVDS